MQISLTAVRDPWHGSPSIVCEVAKECMWDDGMINKLCAQLPLFGFCLHGTGSVIGKRCRERVTMRLFVFVHSCMDHMVM